MNLQKTLSALVRAITAEAERNQAFKESLERALTIDYGTTGGRQPPSTADATRKGRRRTPAVLDPVELVRQGEDVLRDRLGNLNLEQLRDIVAQYGMDPGKLVIKWKDTNRIMDRIVEIALSRATKGDAFRG